MSCEVAAAVFLMFAAQAPAEPAQLIRAADPVAAPADNLMASPMFVDIVGRASRLLGFTNGYRDLLKEDPQAVFPEYAVFRNELKQLAELDTKAAQELEAKSPDTDLKCILRGISADMGLKAEALAQAKDAREKDKALRELAYLLNDNVEVIKAPPAPPV